MVARAEERVRRTVPGADVAGQVAVGAAVEELERASSAWSLMVLGSRGLGAFAGMLIGSVSDRVARRAACPVVVVRGDATPADRPVLLGVDGAPDSAPAAGFAFAAAERRGVPVVALTAARPVWGGSPDWLLPDAGVGAELRELQEDALRDDRRRHPGVPVQHRPVLAGAARALIEASADCGLVVVGSRGRSGLRGDLTGSVSGHLLRHAYCPVAVIRA